MSGSTFPAIVSRSLSGLPMYRALQKALEPYGRKFVLHYTPELDRFMADPRDGLLFWQGHTEDIFFLEKDNCSSRAEDFVFAEVERGRHAIGFPVTETVNFALPDGDVSEVVLVVARHMANNVLAAPIRGKPSSPYQRFRIDFVKSEVTNLQEHKNSVSGAVTVTYIAATTSNSETETRLVFPCPEYPT